MTAAPPFRVLERFARAKEDPTPYDPTAPGSPDADPDAGVGGDDRIVVTPHFAAVLDGVGLGRTVGGEPAGRVATRLGAEVFASLPPNATARQAVDRLSGALADAYPKDPDPSRGRGPAFALVAFSAARRELWRVADCQYLIDGAGDNPGIRVDAVAARARAVVTRGALAAGRSVEELRRADPGYAALVTHFVAQSSLVNHPSDPYGYGVIDGTPVPARFVEVIAVPAGAREIVLASDGYPELRPTLDESEALLAEIARDDPLLIERFVSHRGIPPGREWHDDRSYLRLELAP